MYITMAIKRQVDHGREFMGGAWEFLSKHDVKISHGYVNLHRDQGIVEFFNRTLAEILFLHQYADEIKLCQIRDQLKGWKDYPQLYLQWIVK